MSRRVDDVNFYVFPRNRYVLRQDGYAPFAFQIVSIQHLSAVILPFAKELSRKHHLVYQRGFSMVHVGDDGYISNVLHCLYLIEIDCKVTDNYWQMPLQVR